MDCIEIEYYDGAGLILVVKDFTTILFGTVNELRNHMVVGDDMSIRAHHET